MLGFEIPAERHGSVDDPPLRAFPEWGITVRAEDVVYHLLPPITYQVHYQVPTFVFVHTFNRASGRSAMGGADLGPWLSDAGGSCMIAPETSVRLVQLTPLEYLALEIAPERIARVAPELGTLPLHETTLDRGLACISSEIRRTLIAEPVGSEAYLDRLLDALLVRASIHLCIPDDVQAPAETLSSANARRLTQLIDERLTGPVRVGELAEQVGLSRSHFSRAFSQRFGLAPQRYILDRRIAKARGLLVETDLPVSDIAMMCGFATPSHLSKAFKRAIGLTPTAYRRSLTAPDRPVQA